MTEHMTSTKQREMKIGRLPDRAVAMILLMVLILLAAAVVVLQGKQSGVATVPTVEEPQLVDPYWLHNRDRAIQPQVDWEDSPYLTEPGWFQAQEYEDKVAALKANRERWEAKHGQ